MPISKVDSYVDSDGKQQQRNMRVADKLATLIGRIVVIEGTFPIPVGQGENGPKIAYSPAKGKLVEVFEDGFSLLEDDESEPELWWFTQVRNVQPYSEIAKNAADATQRGLNRKIGGGGGKGPGGGLIS